MSKSGCGNPDSSTDTESKESLHECRECGKTYTSYKGLQYHYKNTECNGYECPECGKNHFTKWRGVVTHYSQHHEGSIAGVEYNCDYCGDRFRRPPGYGEKVNNLFCSKHCHSEWRSIQYSGKNNPSYTNAKTTISCDNCGKEYDEYDKKIDRNKNNYCSVECKSLHNTVEVTCYTCDKVFRKKKTQYERSERHFCSMECRVLREEKTCVICGDSFGVYDYNKDQKRCSYECMGEWFKQEYREESECKNCGKTIEYRLSENHSFCSRDCWYKYSGESNPERAMRLFLEHIGLEYEQEYRLPGSRFFADFFIPSRNVVIEVDGGYWHDLPDAERRDAQKDILCGILGIDMIRVTGTDALELLELESIEG